MNLLNNYFLNSAFFAQSGTESAVPTAVSQVVDSAVPIQAWTNSMLVPIVLGAVGYLFIQHGVVKSKAYFAAGAVAVLLAVGFALGFTPGTFDSYVLMAFCAVATGGGIGFLTAREPVYAALGFATAVLSVCGVLFMQSALFIAAATMIVYAGATIIIFLFVLMFAQQTELRTYDVQLNNPLVAAAIGAILLATITMCVTKNNAILPVRVDSTRVMSAASLPDSLSSEAGKEASKKLDAIDPNLRYVPKLTAGLGRSMYTDYLLAVELAGTVLLVATIGAIALAQRTTETQS
ncbi:MAG: NADH-quinone oxidoreductase subunit J [Planctomycetota bacterium]|nr:NADH-quinone oxidoreductase subunit J [Planctomycetota bacterium]